MSRDFEEFGFQTTLHTGDETRAKHICALHLEAYADELQPEITNLNTLIAQRRSRGAALHAHLYDRPIPVSDAAMLVQHRRAWALLTLTLLAVLACYAGNLTTFYLFGFGVLLTALVAAGTTALPLVVGHLAYERLIAGRKSLQVAVIVIVVALCFGGLYRLADARRVMVDKATAQSVPQSYVDDGAASAPDERPLQEDHSEASVHANFGQALFLIMIASEIALSLLVGRFVHLREDEDYAAWRKLKKISEILIALERRLVRLHSSIEIGRKQCMAGVLRALAHQNKRRPPYHNLVLPLILLVVLGHGISEAQHTERQEVILIDTSASIAQRGRPGVLLKQYVSMTRKLLLTEPANSRVYVVTITGDSFGSARELLSGRTPDARGVMTGELDRARLQLAESFKFKASRLSATARGTDIFGALWRVVALSDQDGSPQRSRSLPKTIWIFSDMANETRHFSMSALLPKGQHEMFAQVNHHGLLVPLHGYQVHICGATLTGLSSETWFGSKAFWATYLEKAGASLVEYSSACAIVR